jgi:hypothetical protein
MPWDIKLLVQRLNLILIRLNLETNDRKEQHLFVLDVAEEVAVDVTVEAVADLLEITMLQITTMPITTDKIIVRTIVKTIAKTIVKIIVKIIVKKIDKKIDQTIDKIIVHLILLNNNKQKKEDLDNINLVKTTREAPDLLEVVQVAVVEEAEVVEVEEEVEVVEVQEEDQTSVLIPLPPQPHPQSHKKPNSLKTP